MQLKNKKIEFDKTLLLCSKKFENYIKNYKNAYEFDGACYSGDYFNECKRQDLFNRFNWTSSFITGLAPIYYEVYKDEKYLKWAEKFSNEYYDKIFNHSLDTMHDIGFLYYLYSVKIYEITCESVHRQTAVKACDELAKRFEPKGKYIDAWRRIDETGNEGRAIIDCIMNLPLLFWGWKEISDSNYLDIALQHIKTTITYFIRHDFSVAHSFVFDRITGEMIKEDNCCGYSNGSWWSRGTAWAVYGFALAGAYTQNSEYVKLSEQLLGAFRKKSEGLIPIWDLRLPEDMPAKWSGTRLKNQWDAADENNCSKNIDTSAAAIMADGAFELYRITKDKSYFDYAIDVAYSLLQYVNSDENVPGILSHQNGEMTYAVYGDYYFVDLLKNILEEITC